MTKGDPKRVDRDLLHALLWKRADSSGRLRLNQSHLADELMLDRTTVSRIFREMMLQGRIQKVNEGYRRLSLYKITDPDTFKWASGSKQS